MGPKPVGVRGRVGPGFRGWGSGVRILGSGVRIRGSGRVWAGVLEVGAQRAPRLLVQL